MKIINTASHDPKSITAFEREQVYNGLDSAITLECFESMEPELDATTRATYDFSRSLQGPALEMRLRGVLVDERRKAEVIEEFYERIEILEHSLERIVREGVGMPGFNWRSNKDLQALFYGQLGIPPILRGGRPTTDRGARERFESYTLARPLAIHVSMLWDIIKKIDVLKTEIDADGRMRTSYNIAGTSTGRFSSSFSEFGTGGNLQNIEESLRSIFIADPGYKLAKFDAKSGESFCVGAIEWNLFGDETYLAACESGDPHTAVARICWPNLAWSGNLKRDKALAEQPYYRHYSYRFMCKKLGHGCLTEDHEVLTRNGWRPITEQPAEIMIWHDMVSHFDEVQHWTDFQYTGQLHSFEGNSISALMTPDHRVPYKSDTRQAGVKERRAHQGPGIKMPLGDNYEGGTTSVPSRFIAAFMADGYQDGYGCTFHFKKERKIERLIQLCEAYELAYKKYDMTDGSTKINVKIFHIPKRPGAFMFDWTEECLRDFLDEIKHWDGYIGPTSVSIASTRREDLEWFQTFGRILGIGGQIQEPQISGFGSIVYRLQQNNRRWAAGSSVVHTQRMVENTRVLCPTVASGWFYVRRNGKIFVTGNSNYGGKPETLAAQSKLPIAVVRDFQPKYFRAFPSHTRWHEAVDHQLRRHGHLVSLTGRKRYFFGRRTSEDTFREALAYDPQCSLADVVNRAMLRIWRERPAILWAHDHDALTFMYPEEAEDEVVPKLIEMLPETVALANGREMRIPYDAKTGYNKADYDEKDNPDGLKDYYGHDNRKRSTTPGILDRTIRRKVKRTA